MRISDWSSDVCSSDLSSLAFTVIAFQKSRSSCNHHPHRHSRAIVIAFQKSRSSCNSDGMRRMQERVIELQKSQYNSNASSLGRASTRVDKKIDEKGNTESKR